MYCTADAKELAYGFSAISNRNLKLNRVVFINVFMPPAFIEHLLYSKYCAAAEDDREVK